jgi:hypothetical protein
MHPTQSNRYWKRWPNYPYDSPTNSSPSWDWQREYFDDHMCPEAVGQSIWCAGFPRSNDPRYSNYPPNDTAYVVYGPVDLSQAVAGGCSFYLYSRSEIAHDSIFWGLTTIPPPNWKMHLAQYHDSIYIAGSFSQVMDNVEFQQHVMDFSRVHRIGTLDTVSLLGRSAVWVYWRFKADANTNVNTGSFIDNISISWDDGGQDISALCGTINHLDGTINSNPEFGDTAYAALTWTTCPGGIQQYPPFRAVVMMDTMVIQDTIISDAVQGMTYTLNTHRWVMSSDTHRIYMRMDSLDQVPETNEANDSCGFTYTVPRPTPPAAFNWVAPLDSNLTGDQSVTLRWECYDDPLYPASLSFFSSTLNVGCQGIAVPGGSNRPCIDGPDSLVWDLRQYNYGRVLWVYVRIHDAHNDTCMYAPFPVIRRHGETAVGDGTQSLIPDHFFLDQNYPNPFNPKTELRYGVAKGGAVTLKVFDLLGREAAVLYHGEQSPGTYMITFDGDKLPSGLYLYRLTTPEGTQTRKMMLMK